MFTQEDASGLPIIGQNLPQKVAKTPRFVAKGTFSQAHFRNFVAKVYPSQPVFLRKVTFSQIAFRKKRTAKARKVDFRRCERCGRRFLGGRSFGSKRPKIGLKADSSYLYTYKTPQNPKSLPGGPSSKRQKNAKMSNPPGLTRKRAQPKAKHENGS